MRGLYQTAAKQMRTAVLTAAIVITALAAVCHNSPSCRGSPVGRILLRSTSFCSSSERQEADAVFARYRREGKPEEPVIASTTLFRYAHDRNLFWLTRLHGRPAPIWILGDSADPYAPFRISTRYNKSRSLEFASKTTDYLTVAVVSCCSGKGSNSQASQFRYSPVGINVVSGLQ